MTIATRTKLVAYEDSLSGSDPFEDGSYTSVGETAKTPTEKNEHNEQEESVQEKERNVNLFSSVEETKEQMKDEEKETETTRLPQAYILTTEAIEKQLIDPMIGMENVKP